MLVIANAVPEPPLSVDEVMACLRQRWRATYDLQLVVRRRRLYLQVMWAYLEQQSFPMDLEAYRQHLGEVLDVVNRLGLRVRCANGSVPPVTNPVLVRR